MYFIREIIRPSTIVEIGFLSILIYLVMYFFRKTLGPTLLRGAIFFFVIFYIGVMSIADLFGFVIIKTTLQLLLSFSFIVAVVVFAPEIRKALISLASTRLFSRLVKPPAPNVVEAIIKAVMSLSAKRHGAIIVLEGNVSLDEFIRRGTVLDAEISQELIESIFIPNTPMHDGALIIRRYRVASAGSVLPLSEKEFLFDGAGTRHRAALGITEISDALAIVVSEETSIISICVHGEFKRDLTEKSLRDTLLKFFSGERRPDVFTSFLRRLTKRQVLEPSVSEQQPVPDREEKK